MIKQRFAVAGMTCPNCAMRIEALEDRLPGIREIVASYRRGEMTVEYDETLVTLAEIVAAVERMEYSMEAAG